MTYIGSVVRLGALERRADLNERVGCVLGVQQNSGRVPVQLLPAGEKVLLKMENITVLSWGETHGLSAEAKSAADQHFATTERPRPAEHLSPEDRARAVRIGLYGEHEGKMAWGDFCRDVKARNGGDYPGDWYELVIRRGLFPESTRQDVFSVEGVDGLLAFGR